ncbi:CoA pyrophosphatase [Nitrogeniibacter mangrovi]|uniref:CoA pyrophosphatase n=1 Tax=Nitrogeniibacter mangrovi TaxID=2016596 RepID=A0A6C1B691_9RHOO|nr:CoA pyrophosphatase [Nitrogeniibacter mangrovi]QID18228.1 CoA pyrophosphatase [Nitrogeniibacter mangrovi]
MTDAVADSSRADSLPDLSIEHVRDRFARIDVSAAIVEEGAEGRFRPAAVLVPLVTRPGGLTVMLTQRTDHLHHHPGQISFPGGRVEAGDEGPVGTALRETEEEVGLHRRHVELLGQLPEYRTGTGFCVTPVVGLVHPPFDLSPDSFEVAEVFEVPLDFLVDPLNHRRETLFYRGRERTYYAMPWRHYHIWGATAGMLVALSGILREI